MVMASKAFDNGRTARMTGRSRDSWGKSGIDAHNTQQVAAFKAGWDQEDEELAEAKTARDEKGRRWL
jgi:hypothetical protein